MAIKTIRVFQEFTSAGYVPMPVAGNIDYGVTIANTFPATTPTTFQTDDPDIDVTLTATTDYYVWIRSHGTDWNPMYTRNVRVYPDSPLINNVVMGIIIANLSGTVPYTGATTNVDLGTYGLKADYLQLNTSPTSIPTTEGTIAWDSPDGTANLRLKGGNINLQIGEDSVARVVNGTTTNLLKADYKVVKIIGAQGQRLQIGLALADNDANSKDTIGLVAENINNNQEGFIMTSGLLDGINTTGSLQGETWNDGDTLYLSGTTAGKITNIKPQAPIHTIILGFVAYSHQNNGKIYVKVDNGYELDELHNVKIVGALNKDVLVYNSTTKVWENRIIFKTQGYVPYYDDTLLLNNSPLYTNGNNVAIGSLTLTEKLVVGGNVLANQFKKVGGLSTEFLKADGSSDATAYQPLSADLTAIDNLALTTGLLRKNGLNTWELDQTEYLSVAIAGSTYQTLANLSSNLTASTTKYPSVNAVNTGLALKLNLTGGTLTGGLTLNYSYPNIALSDVSSGTTWNIQNDGSTFKLNYGATNNFYIFSSGNAAFVNSLTASSLIKSGGTSTQFLKADGSVDNTNYQPYDADLASIAGLELTTGLLRKNGLNTYTLDQTEYVALSTANSTYQTLANLQSNLNASSTKYPSVNAVNTGLNLKLNLAGGVLTGDLALAYSYPNIQLNDTGSGTIWNIQNDGGGFEINSGTTNKFVMYSSGNATFVNDLTANKFIKSGGTSSQFLMADGSVSSGNAGTVTSVGLSAPTGFSVSGSPVTTSGTLALAFSAGYSLPSDATQATWTAKQNALNGTGFVKISGTTISYDNSTYYLASNPSGYISGITSLMVTNALGYIPYNSSNPSGYISGNQTITLSGDVSGSGTTAITTTLATITQVATGSFVKITLDTKGRVTGNVAVGSSDIISALGYTPYNATNPNGYTTNVGTVTSLAMSVPTGLSISGTPITTSGTLALSFALGYSIPTTSSQGTWDTAYNRSLTSIGVSGTTTKTLTLTKQDGTTLTASWSDINTDAVTSVFGRTGAIVATSGDYTTAQVTESGNLYYLDSRARASIIGGTGISYNSTTGVITNTITQYTDALARASISGGTGISYNSTSGVITNTITQYTDALARASLSFVAGSGAYNSTTGVITIPTNTSQLTNGAGYITGITSGMVTTALGYTPVTNARTLTINGTTYDLSADRSWTISGTIGGLTSGYIPKATSASTLGNSLIYDNGTNVGINTTSPSDKLTLNSSGTGTGFRIIGYQAENFISLNNVLSTSNRTYRLSAGITGVGYDGFSIFDTIANDTRFVIHNTGNIGINTSTDAGYKLDVNGIVRFNGAIVSTGNLTTLGDIFITGASKGIIFNSSVNYNTQIYESAGSLYFRTGGVDRLGLSSSGNATFSNAIIGNQGLSVSGYGGISNSANKFVLDFYNGNTRLYSLGTNTTTKGGYEFHTNSSDGSLDVIALGIASSGAATFSSSVTAIKTTIGDNGFGSQWALMYHADSTGASNPFIGIDSSSGSVFYNVKTNGSHVWRVNNSTQMTLTTAGNLGLGVTPSAWSGGSVGLDIGGDPFSGINGSLRLALTTNAYAIGATYYYRSSGLSSQQYRLSVGTNNHEWYNAPSGTAGGVISYTQAMTLTASGNLMVGTTSLDSSSPKLQINGSIISTTSSITAPPSTASVVLDYHIPSNAGRLMAGSGGAWNKNVAIVPYGGSALIGTTTDSGYKLDVNGTGRFSGALTINQTAFTFGSGLNLLNWQLVSGGDSGLYIGYSGTTRLSIASTGAATFSNTITVNGSGNFSWGFPSTAVAKIGAPGTGGSLLVMTPSLNSGYESGLAIDGTYSGGKSEININAFGVYSGGPYSADLVFKTSTNTTLSEKMRITNAGLVGIGTTSPSTIFHVVGTSQMLHQYSGSPSTFAYGQYNTSGDASINNLASANLLFATANTERMRITSGGNLAFVADPFIYSNTTAGGTAIHSGLRFHSTDKYIRFFTNDLGRMDITSAGNVLIGTTTDAGFKLNLVSSTAPIASFTGSTNGYIDISDGTVTSRIQNSGGLFIGTVNSYDLNLRTNATTRLTIAASTGAATFSSSVTATGYFESSDRTIKTLITDNYLVKGIESITAKLYTKHGKEELGYFAQDVQGILPSAVTKGTNGLLNLSYREVLVAKVQSLEQRVKELETQLNLG